MLAYVDIQHRLITEDPILGSAHLERRQQFRQNIEKATGLKVQLVHYSRFDGTWARKTGVRALMISGNSYDWCDYDWAEFEPLQAVVREGELPVMGFCGGHQFIALTFAGVCGPIGPLGPGEADPDPPLSAGTMAEAGMKKERGFLPVRIVKPDPLLAGLSSPFVVYEAHYWEVKQLPKGFAVLASTDLCPIQMMRHAQSPWCGTQFHPEAYSDEYPDGGRILLNFCQVFGLVR